MDKLNKYSHDERYSSRAETELVMESKFAPKIVEKVGQKKETQYSESIDFGKSNYFNTKDENNEEFKEYVAVEGKSFDGIESLNENSTKVDNKRKVIKPLKKNTIKVSNNSHTNRAYFNKGIKVEKRHPKAKNLSFKTKNSKINEDNSDKTKSSILYKIPANPKENNIGDQESNFLASSFDDESSPVKLDPKMVKT